jgi:chaperonin cofactor prefoldin
VQELERLEPDAGVFKLVGPVLVRQDLVEARANVTKRLEYISGERRAARAARRAAGPRAARATPRRVGLAAPRAA